MSSSPVTSATNLNAMKVAELRKELKDRGITMPGSAKKQDLVSKLTEIMDSSSSPTITTMASQETIPSPPSEDSFMKQIDELASGDLNISSANATLGSTISSISTAASVTPSTPVVETGKGVIKPIAVVPKDAKPDPLAARAARFGVSVSPAAQTSEQLVSLKKRAERFGEIVSPVVSTLEEKAKLAQRASRFNISELDQKKNGAKVPKVLGLKRKSDTSKSTPEPAKKVILSPEEEERLRKRKERFGSS